VQSTLQLPPVQVSLQLLPGQAMLQVLVPVHVWMQLPPFAQSVSVHDVVFVQFCVQLLPEQSIWQLAPFVQLCVQLLPGHESEQMSPAAQL